MQAVDLRVVCIQLSMHIKVKHIEKKMFKKEIVNVNISDENKDSDVADEQMPTEDTGEIDDVSEEACEIDLHDLEKQFEHNLAALF